MAALLGMGSSVCNSIYKEQITNNWADKMTIKPGEPNSAGADFFPGARAATVYLHPLWKEHPLIGGPNNVYRTGITKPNSITNNYYCKIAIHEYIHILQQAFLTGSLTSTTPPVDNLGATRFQVYAPDCPTGVGSPNSTVPPIFFAKIKRCLDLLPASMKLLAVPTIFVLSPGGDNSPMGPPQADKNGVKEKVFIYSAAQIATAKAYLADKVFGTNCPTMTEKLWITGGMNKHLNENGQMAEGDANTGRITTWPT